MSRQSRRNRGTTEVTIRSEPQERSRSRSSSTRPSSSGRGTDPHVRPGHGMARRAQEIMPSMPNPSWTGAGEAMREFARDMSRMFDRWAPGRMGAFMGWPAVEMFDRNGEFVVRAELPGLQKDDVHLRVSGDSLVIEGERRNEREEHREGYFESEWSYGHFSRRIPLPSHVDAEEMRANFRDGVLEVSMRLDRPMGRNIPIDESGPAGEMRGG